MNEANNHNFSPPRSRHNNHQRNNQMIMSTADDAILSKLSTVNEGYYEDPFIHYLSNDGSRRYHRHPSASSASSSSSSRHRGGTIDNYQPLIRRGTYARVCTIDYAISSFLSMYESKEIDVQIVVLGSGRDTNFLRAKSGLLHGGEDEEMMDHVTWYEVDHSDIIQLKQQLLHSCPLLDMDFEKYDHTFDYEDGETVQTSSYAITTKEIRTSISSKKDGTKTGDNNDTNSSAAATQQYHLIAFDLHKPFSNLLELLTTYHSFNVDAPTLFVMECVQMYLPELESRNLLKSITNSIKQPFISIFDPIIQHDAFGQVMAQNLTKAKIITTSSMSLLQTRTLQNHIDKLVQCGFKYVTGCDFMTCYETILNGEDRTNANMCEMLDEVEEWILIMKHYCFVVAAGGGGGTYKDTSKNSDDDMTEMFCSVDENNPLGLDSKRCLSHKST